MYVACVTCINLERGGSRGRTEVQKFENEYTY
jgi:hypothetical protein